MDLKELKDLEGTEEYRLVMLQADPESGERLCVGVIVAGDLLYDERLPRAQCFYANVKPELIRFYLRDLQERSRNLRGEALDRVATEYAPLFVLSHPRMVTTPVQESTKHMLLTRFVGGRSDSAMSPTEQGPKGGMGRELFAEKLRQLAAKINSPAESRVIENARPQDIFGERRKGIGPVAMAIKRRDKTVLMDGVDLNVLKAKEAISATGKVVHTFWQYRVAAELYGDNLKRIAVVFNGVRPREYALKDAHDFAIDQFHKEADDTIEASSSEEVNRLAALLA